MLEFEIKQMPRSFYPIRTLKTVKDDVGDASNTGE